MTVPVFITYRDRHNFLAKTIVSLLERGFDDITVIDNDSAEPPRLPPKIKIVESDNSHRQLAPWMLGLVPEDAYYIVQDCDAQLDCPADVEKLLIEGLEAHPEIDKLGLGIRVDDLLFPPPEHYAYSYLMEYSVEYRFPHIAPGIISAPVDTFHAMHRPGSGWSGIVGARTTPPYVARHLPWYLPEYSAEEKLYYSRAGKPWTLGHSAGTLLEHSIIVPFVDLRAETVKALQPEDPRLLRYAPVDTGDGYWTLLRDVWAMGSPAIVVEQDIVVNETTLDELRICDFDWCAMPFPYRGEERAYALACSKFSSALMARHPDLLEAVGRYSDELHPARHWCRLDAWIFAELTKRGEIRHDHTRAKPLGHVGPQFPSHGCLER